MIATHALGADVQVLESRGGDTLVLPFTEPATFVERAGRGAGWQPQQPFMPGGWSSDFSRAAMLPDGRLVAGIWNFNSCVVGLAERDRRGRWAQPTLFSQSCDRPDLIAQPPAVAIGPHGVLLAAWAEVGGPPDYPALTLVLERTRDGAWHGPLLVDGATPVATAVNGHGDGLVAMDSFGSLQFQHAELLFVTNGEQRQLRRLQDDTNVAGLASNTAGRVVLSVNRLAGSQHQPAYVDVYAGLIRGSLPLRATFGSPRSGASASRASVAINERGDAVVAWAQVQEARVLASRRVALGSFGPPVAILPAAGAIQGDANAYIAPDGSAAVVWRQTAPVPTLVDGLKVATAPLSAPFTLSASFAYPANFNGPGLGVLAGDASGGYARLGGVHADERRVAILRLHTQ